MFNHVCLFTGRSHVVIKHDAFDLTIQGPPWTWSLIVQGPPHPKPPALHLVAIEAHTVGKRAVHILLECFLVCLCELKGFCVWHLSLSVAMGESVSTIFLFIFPNQSTVYH